MAVSLLTLILPLFTTLAGGATLDNCESNFEGTLSTELNTWIQNGRVAGSYRKAAADNTRKLESALNAIAAIKPQERNFQNTVLAADRALDAFAAHGMTLRTMASLIDLDAELAKEVAEFEQAYHAGLARFASDSRLYAAIQATEVPLGQEAELKSALLRRLKNGGADLSQEARARIQELTGEAAALAVEFRTAMQDDPTAVELNESELAGLDKDFVARYTQGARVRVPVSDPAVVEEFLRNAASENARKRVYLAYRGRNPENAERLLKLTRLNAEIAKINGKKNFVEKVISDRSLAGGPEQISQILNELKAGFQPAIQARLNEMAARKAQDSAEPLQVWDWFYYDSRVPRPGQHSVQKSGGPSIEERAADYFPATRFLGSFFQFLYSRFGVRFEPVRDAAVWHESVVLYKVLDARNAGKPLGYIYMDLYNRKGKNPSTAFVEELISRRREPGSKERLPVAVLMTNWGPWEDRMTLNVSLGDVQTTLHEMGHALHAMFQQGSYFTVSGWTHPTDYMEVPSTSLDRLVKEPEILVELSSHRDDPERKLPLELAEKLAAAERGFKLTGGDFFSSSHMMQTVFLSQFDIEVQKQIGDLKTPEDLHALYRRMFIDFFGADPTAGDHFAQTFHHIAGEYAANYSSYIWAGLVAANVVDRMKELGGLQESKPFLQWRKVMLEAPQHEIKASAIMESFLGRPLSAEPVFREQGLR